MTTSKMRRLIAATAAAVGVGLVLTACSGGTNSTDGGGSGDGGSVVLVHTQPAGDGSVIDSQISGLKKIGDELGYSTNDVYVSDPANFQSTLQNVVDTSPTVVVTSFPQITDAFNATAEANPNIKFVHLYADAVEPALPNLLTVSYDYYNVMYLSGVFAATFSETGKIGWVGGDTAPLASADYNAYVLGAQSVNSNIQVTPGVVGSYSDTAKAQEVANQLYNSGIDVIQTDAGGADAGVASSAQQSDGRWLISGGVSSFDSAGKVTLAASVADFDVSVQESVRAVVASDFTGGASVTKIGDVIKLVTNPTPPSDSAAATRFTAATTAVETATAAVQAGTVDIPLNTNAP